MFRPITRTVNVAASWVGVGNRTPIQEMLGDPHGSCTEMDVINGFVRESSVTLTIDGQAVNAYGNLQSLDAHQTVRTNCDDEDYLN
jgi:aerobic-type carbon monoxide dehydrogenase small subunit (CoxS/CutS family)